MAEVGNKEGVAQQERKKERKSYALGRERHKRKPQEGRKTDRQTGGCREPPKTGGGGGTREGAAQQETTGRQGYRKGGHCD